MFKLWKSSQYSKSISRCINHISDQAMQGFHHRTREYETWVHASFRANSFKHVHRASHQNCDSQVVWFVMAMSNMYLVVNSQLGLRLTPWWIWNHMSNQTYVIQNNFIFKENTQRPLTADMVSFPFLAAYKAADKTKKNIRRPIRPLTFHFRVLRSL